MLGTLTLLQVFGLNRTVELLRGRVPAPLQETAGGLLRHLSLLFVPAGVGVMVHATRLETEALPIVIALFGSTLIGIAVTAKLMAFLLSRTDPRLVDEPAKGDRA